MNHLITNNFAPSDHQYAKNSSHNLPLLNLELSSEDLKDHQLKEEIKSKIEEVGKIKSSLNLIKSDIDSSFTKLKTILESRNELSDILKEFNSSSRQIMGEQEKLQKLNLNIEKIYKMYEETLSIEAFFENTKEDVCEKLRFTSDYELIENGISFFSLNSNFIESEKYLNTYNMLKRIAITRHYNYMSQSLQSYLNSLEGIPISDPFFLFVLNFLPRNMNKKFYFFPINYEKMKSISTFFEKKAVYDYDIKRNLEGVKNNFMEKRTGMIKLFYEEVLNDIKKNFDSISSNTLAEKKENPLYKDIEDIFHYTLLEICYFLTLFQSKAQDNTYILQTFTSDLFGNLYNTIRPLIIYNDSVDGLILLFESFFDNFEIFFLDIEEDSDSPTQNKENIDSINERILSFFIRKTSSLDSNSNNIISELNRDKIEKLKEIITISKILIRPTVLKVIQDIQEKIVFKIHNNIKTGFLELENDFSNLSQYEEQISHRYKNFPLLHFYLRRMSVLLELLKNKLDISVLNELTVQAVEKFINILDDEIVSKKNNLSVSFQIYIIQQIILIIKLLEEFQVEAVETGLEIDFYSLTDMFRSNLQAIFSNAYNVRELIMNTAPQIHDKTRDFKKVLSNRLLKSYKILFNLANGKIFGTDLMEIIFKIRGREPMDEQFLKSKVEGKKDLLLDIYNSFENIIKDINSQLGIIDKEISEKLCSTIVENISLIINQIVYELDKYKDTFAEEKDILHAETINNNLLKLKQNLMD
jgi:hypothetical protein